MLKFFQNFILPHTLNGYDEGGFLLRVRLAEFTSSSALRSAQKIGGFTRSCKISMALHGTQLALNGKARISVEIEPSPSLIYPKHFLLDLLI